MRITMKETRRISEDAFTVRRLEAGKTYEVADTAACHILRSGWGVEAEKTVTDLLFAVMKPSDPAQQLRNLNALAGEQP